MYFQNFDFLHTFFYMERHLVVMNSGVVTEKVRLRVQSAEMRLPRPDSRNFSENEQHLGLGVTFKLSVTFHD